MRPRHVGPSMNSPLLSAYHAVIIPNAASTLARSATASSPLGAMSSGGIPNTASRVRRK